MDSTSQDELQRLQRVVQFVKMQVHAFTSLAEGNPDLQTFLKTLRGVLTMDTDSNGLNTDENGSPKTRSKRKNADEVPHIPEINLLFEPLKCHLCTKDFNSASIAKAHYEGKKHRNKTILWLRGKNKGKNGDETGENEGTEGEEGTDVKMEVQDGPPQPKKKRDMAVDENDPNRFCKTCKVKMLSDMETKSHYAGKKHLLRLSKEQQKQIAGGEDQQNFSVDQSIEQCIPVA